MIIRLLAIICILGFSILPANAFWFGGGGSGVPGGTNEQVQYRNEAGTFSGHVGLVYNAATAKLTVGYLSAGGGYNNLINAGGGTWTKTRQLTVTAPAQILPAGYSVRVALAGAAAASVFNSGTVDALRIATSVATVATTITAAITSTQTTIAVASIAGLTTVGIIKIENEYIGYNGWTGLVLNNCVRGSMGSIPATHVNAAAVTSIQELERYVSAYTADSVVVWFKLRSQIAAAGTDTTYTLHYENDLAGSAPKNGKNVFDFFDDFSIDTSANYVFTGATGTKEYDGVNMLLKQSNTASSQFFLINNTYTLPSNYAYQFSSRITNDVAGLKHVGIIFNWTTASNGYRMAHINSKYYIDRFTAGEGTLLVDNIADGGLNLLNQWVTLRAFRYGGGAYTTGATDGVTAVSGSGTDATYNGGFLGFHSYGCVNEYDNVRVRVLVADDTLSVDGNFAAGGNEVVSGDYVGELKSLNNTTLKKLSVIAGTNCSMGLSTLVAGSVVVSNTLVTANSRIFLTKQTDGSSGYVNVTARTAGVSFTITSSSGTDTASIAWWIVEPQ